MRLKYFTYILLVAFLAKASNCYSQNVKNLSGKESDSLIIWTKDRKLKWSDFKSNDQKYSLGGAHSSVGIKMIPYLSKNRLYEYKILPYFFKKESWSDNDNEYLLKHEQLHFDIEELFARKMRQKIYNLKLKDKFILPSTYRLIYEKINGQKNNYQDQYDLDTDHSKLPDKQKEWEAKIAKELEKLKEFSLKTSECKTD